MHRIAVRFALSRPLDGTLSAEQGRAEVERLADEYEQRARFWTEHPPYGLEAEWLGRQHEAARQFVVVSREVVKTDAEADKAAMADAVARAHVRYPVHRAGVDATVSAASQFSEISIAHAAGQATWGNRV